MTISELIKKLQYLEAKGRGDDIVYIPEEEFEINDYDEASSIDATNEGEIFII